MYRISELAQRVGVSRATLLYYEKLGLLKGRREANGYRVYSDADRQRLELMQQLQAGGLSLQECRACLDGKLDRDRLEQRLHTLDAELAGKTRSRDLLSALLGRSSLKTWHETLERVAPDLHRAWLMTQGFSSEDAARIALLSKDMNMHDDYMDTFMRVFSELEYWGPGSAEATRRAVSLIPFKPRSILEIGCGRGVATLVLADATSAQITATDTADDALETLRSKVKARGLAGRIAVEHADMAALPAPAEPYDVLWAEGSAYVIGVETAFKAWRSLLRPGGVLVVSDMVWRTDNPAASVAAFWQTEYPAMTTPAERVRQAEKAGYQLVSHFDMGREAMEAYYAPLEARVAAMADELEGSRVQEDLKAELNAWREGEGQVSYEMFVLQRT
jgi:DNA-binding transcriptional MerR regulator/predicted O-methyltransferase YrrM